MRTRSLISTALLAAAVMIMTDDVSGQSAGYAAQRFELGPVPPTVDLRNMVRAHIVRRCCEGIDAGAARRDKAIAAGAWKAWRDEARRTVRKGLGEMMFGPDGPPLNVRAVSRHERQGYVVENVLFESLPGWDVNGSVYLPLASQYPPPWPGIVVPVGHSGKQFESYQIPAQVFARCGYVAITFDPPGMSGEKRAGNDHFNDGVRCYLTGHSSNRYFVIDALRCIDYLATRKDVDLRNGVGMTGVSGGGTTTMFATLLDERIRASGPTCCAVPNAYHPVLDCYAPCAETLAADRFGAGLDDVDILIAATPTPLLLMAGAADEVFKIEWGRRIAADVKAAYDKIGHADRFRFFSDPGGHSYTVAMAVEFVRWMDRWVRATPDRKLPAIKRDDLEMISPDLLKCRPRQEGNMFSVNAEFARRLRTNRSGKSIRQGSARTSGSEIGEVIVLSERSLAVSCTSRATCAEYGSGRGCRGHPRRPPRPRSPARPTAQAPPASRAQPGYYRTRSRGIRAPRRTQAPTSQARNSLRGPVSRGCTGASVRFPLRKRPRSIRRSPRRCHSLHST